MRPGAGPPAEPASQLTRITAARRPQRIRRNGGRRRAASASARGPRPHSLIRSVSQTADAERNKREVLRELRVHCENRRPLASPVCCAPPPSATGEQRPSAFAHTGLREYNTRVREAPENRRVV